MNLADVRCEPALESFVTQSKIKGLYFIIYRGQKKLPEQNFSWRALRQSNVKAGFVPEKASFVGKTIMEGNGPVLPIDTGKS